MMNPQMLIDGVEHGVEGMIVMFDNRRMAAITGLQEAQYGDEFRTNDSVAVDYVALAAAVAGVKAVFGGTTRNAAAALASATRIDGLSVVHVPVYCGAIRWAAWGLWLVECRQLGRGRPGPLPANRKSDGADDRQTHTGFARGLTNYGDRIFRSICGDPSPSPWGTPGDAGSPWSASPTRDRASTTATVTSRRLVRR